MGAWKKPAGLGGKPAPPGFGSSAAGGGGTASVLRGSQQQQQQQHFPQQQPPQQPPQPPQQPRQQPQQEPAPSAFTQRPSLFTPGFIVEGTPPSSPPDSRQI